MRGGGGGIIGPKGPRPICYHLICVRDRVQGLLSAQRRPHDLSSLLTWRPPPPPDSSPVSSGQRRPPLRAPAASASLPPGCLSAAPARRSPLTACRLPCSSVIRAPPLTAASFRWTALKSQDLLSQRQQRRVMSEAAAASIGLSWAPKVPSLPTTRGSKDSGSNPSKQESLWKPGTELVDGLFVPPRDPRKANKLARKNVKDTTGKGWFDMPAPSITPELKKDLEILQLRHVMDPKRHFKRAGKSKVLPKYFQVGTVIEPASEFFSSRLTKKGRKTTLADELLSDQSLKNYRMRKVREIQETRTPGGNQKWKNKGKKTFKRSKDRRK